jgi:phenylpyruvate tautomerase PptA (4-oxalocrotonate tautomerase family)
VRDVFRCENNGRDVNDHHDRYFIDLAAERKGDIPPTAEPPNHSANRRKTNMPFNIVTTEGVLTNASKASTHKAITDCFLRLHNLSGNPFLERHVIGEITTVPKGETFAGGKPENVVIVETLLPSFGLNDPGQKKSYITEVTDIILRASEGRVARERIYVNVVYAVDGLWGIAGKAYTNAELGEALSNSN